MEAEKQLVKMLLGFTREELKEVVSNMGDSEREYAIRVMVNDLKRCLDVK